MEEKYSKIHEDVQNILYDWADICKDPSLLEEAFLQKMQGHILRLNKHLPTLKGDKRLYSLFQHLLHTPPGAPIVCEKTLFQCAQEYASSEAKNSSLYHYLSRSLTTSEKQSNFLFNSLALLDSGLDKAA